MNKRLLEDLQNYDIFEGMTSISAVIKSIQETSSNRKIIKLYYDSSKAKQKTPRRMTGCFVSINHKRR